MLSSDEPRKCPSGQGSSGRIWDWLCVEGAGREVREEFMKTGYIGSSFGCSPALQGQIPFSLSYALVSSGALQR